MNYLSNKGIASISIILIVAALLILGGGAYYYLGRNPVSTPIIPSPVATTTVPIVSTTTPITLPHLFQATDVVQANKQFSLDLYSKYASEKKLGDNIFFSPFSISSAIAMTYEGAKGKTAEEIQNVFHFPSDTQKLRNGYQNIYKDINATGKPYKLSTANALWVQKDYKLFDSYVNTVKTYYDGGITNLDFIKEVTNAVNTINKWVEDQTANRIQNLLSKSDIPPQTKLILTNAIYFKGEWINKFNEDVTRAKEFTMSDSTKYNTQMMEQIGSFKHVELDNVQLLELPYKGNDLSMLVILPKNNNLSSIEDSLTYQQLSGWNSKLEEHLVDVSMPKFKIETKEHMANDLKAMGMPTAFSGTYADFSGIAPINNSSENLYIGDVIHQTFIENKEDGTEAAAATAVTMVATTAAPGGPQPKIYIFNADHPFIFLIQQNQTGNILFVGRVAKP